MTSCKSKRKVSANLLQSASRKAGQRSLASIVTFLCLLVSMIGSAQDHPTVAVEFIQSGEGRAFLVSDFSLDQLPDTFEIDTILNIGNEKWVVDEARPAQKSIFRRTGQLKLFVSKTQVVSAEDMLFSTPSISNDIPKSIPGALQEDVAVYHEDNWRQIEFISRQYDSEITQEIADIEKIYRTQKKDIGFLSIHIRKRIPSPLQNRTLTVQSLRDLFDIAKDFGGAALSSYGAPNGVIVGGFALQTTDGWILWGQADENGTIRFLCLDPENADSNSDSFTSMIEDYIDTNAILLVDWVQGIIIGPGYERL